MFLTTLSNIITPGRSTPLPGPSSTAGNDITAAACTSVS